MKTIKELNEKIENTRASEANIHKNVMPKFITPSSSHIMSPAHKYELIAQSFSGFALSFLFYPYYSLLFYRVLEDFKVPSFSLHVSLTRASSHSNELQRSHFETSGRNRTKDACDSNTCLPISLCLTRMQKSTDVMAAQAEKLFYDCEYKKGFKILNE